MTKEEFLIKARQVHGWKYDYSLVSDILHSTDKIHIICHEKDEFGVEHGSEEVQVNKHLNCHRGCTKCSGRYRRTKEDFVKLATHTHNGRYTYDDFEYVDMKTKGDIYCPKHDVHFMMTPQKHIQGQGCPKCRYEKTAASNTKDSEWFIEKARQIHGDKYDYSKVNYVNNRTKVCIICPEHGEFWQIPTNHIHKTLKQGCPKCSLMMQGLKQRNSQEQFIEKARKVHGDKYDYTHAHYVTNKSMLDIVCPEHGHFSQIASNHLFGQGCPKCACYRSKMERELEEYIRSIYNGVVIHTDRTLLEGTEIDIYLPDKKIGFEFDGLHWHDERSKEPNYHLKKTQMCEDKGVQLIHIFEDEWRDKQEIVKSRIRNLLGNITDRIYARRCEVKEIDAHTSGDFIKKNHIQGNVGANVRLGLYHGSELVSVMTFSHPRKNLGRKQEEDSYELLRFCNRLNTTVVGGASKMLKYFIENFKPRKITSYADRRWSMGGLYEKLGFKKYNESQPCYFYVVDGKRENRFKYRKDVLIKEGYDASKSEHQIMLDRGIYRIYDCGCLCYELTF